MAEQRSARRSAARHGCRHFPSAAQEHAQHGPPGHRGSAQAPPTQEDEFQFLLRKA